jgi:hypothetical protein
MHYAVFSRYQHPKAHGYDSMSTIIVRFREDIESDLADVIKYLNWDGEGLPEPYTHTEQMYGGKGWALVAIFETPPTHLGYKQINIDANTSKDELTLYQHTLGDHRFVGIYDSSQIVPLYYFKAKEYKKAKKFIQYECECLCHMPPETIFHCGPRCCIKCAHCGKSFAQLTEHQRICASATQEQRDTNEAHYQALVKKHRENNILQDDDCQCNCHAEGMHNSVWSGCRDCCTLCHQCWRHINKECFQAHQAICKKI